MNTLQRIWTVGRSGVGLAALLAVVGCGGGGGGSPSSSSAGGSTSVAGVAGTGAPMAGATVTVTCQSGSATATTDANGAFTATFANPPTAPCAIKAVTLDGSGAEVVQYALLDVVAVRASNTANINPATTVVVGEVASGNPERFFSGATPLSNITPAAVTRAVGHVQQLLGTSIDPLKGAYAADKVNELDRKFDQLKIEWDAGNAAITVTSKLSGALVGTVRPSSFDADKASYLARLGDTGVVPASAPAFAALDTQLGAGLTAALASADRTTATTALNALIDSHYQDGGMDRAALTNELWTHGRGAVIGKFSVLRCGQTGTGPQVPSQAYENKPVCRVSAPVTLPNGERDNLDVRVIEYTPGVWLAWGDRRALRVEVHAMALQFVEPASSWVGYRSGLQIWVPIPRGDNPDAQAVPNASVDTAVVSYNGNQLASLHKRNQCATAQYLQVDICDGNFLQVQDATIQAMRDELAQNKVMPSVRVELYDRSEHLLGSYDIQLTTLPVLSSDLADANKPYQGQFATLNAASLAAFQQAGTAPQTFGLGWTAGVTVSHVNWSISSSQGGTDRGTLSIPLGAASASFTSSVAYDPASAWADLTLSSRARDGRKYSTQYRFSSDS